MLHSRACSRARATPLATAALVIGANARDIDVGASFGPDFYSLAHRRGWTHGLLAIAVLPFLDARYLGTDRLGAPVVIVDRDLEARYVD